MRRRGVSDLLGAGQGSAFFSWPVDQKAPMFELMYGMRLRSLATRITDSIPAVIVALSHAG
jgi:hypothetical protein